MKNYILCQFVKGYPVYFKILKNKKIKNYFILTFSKNIFQTLFTSFQHYYTNLPFLNFLINSLNIYTKPPLLKNNIILLIQISNTKLEYLNKQNISNLNFLYFFKINFLKKYHFKVNYWLNIFQNNEIKLIKQSYKTNYTKIFFYETFKIFFYDVNNQYIYSMTKNLPLKIYNSNTNKFFGILATICLKKNPLFSKFIYGLSETIGCSKQNFFYTHLEKKHYNLFFFEKLKFKRSKNFISVIEKLKDFENRKIKKIALVKIYGKLASTFLTYKKKRYSAIPGFITYYSRKYIEKLYQNNLIFYSDTDSLFLKQPISKKWLNGYIGYIKLIFKFYTFFHLYVIHEKRYCLMILIFNKFFFLTTLNISHTQNNFIQSYKCLFLYKSEHSFSKKWVFSFLEKCWSIKSFYKKKINVFQYSTLKIYKTIYIRI